MSAQPDMKAIHQDATKRLQAWQPDAQRIHFHKCDVCKSGLMLSYILPQYEKTFPGGWENCGYWCSRCGFGNAGRRLIESGGAA